MGLRQARRACFHAGFEAAAAALRALRDGASAFAVRAAAGAAGLGAVASAGARFSSAALRLRFRCCCRALPPFAAAAAASAAALRTCSSRTRTRRSACVSPSCGTCGQQLRAADCTRTQRRRSGRTDSSGLTYPGGNVPLAGYTGSGSPGCCRFCARTCRCGARATAVSAVSAAAARAARRERALDSTCCASVCSVSSSTCRVRAAAARRQAHARATAQHATAAPLDRWHTSTAAPSLLLPLLRPPPPHLPPPPRRRCPPRARKGAKHGTSDAMLADAGASRTRAESAPRAGYERVRLLLRRAAAACAQYNIGVSLAHRRRARRRNAL